MTARDREGSDRGLFLSSQAGDNGKSHNHNDTGNFIVYVDGRPAVIDLGQPQYVEKSFGSERYEIWANQSAWHNLPTIRGVMQAVGHASAAREVSYLADATAATLRSDPRGHLSPGGRGHLVGPNGAT